MNETSYWTKLTTSRITRRRALLGAAGLAAGAAALSISCGSSDAPTDTKVNDKLYVPAEGKAVKGGILPLVGGNQFSSYTADANGTGAIFALHAYSRIVKYETFKYPAKTQPSVVADAATSWETSPDGLQVTYKLRPGFKFDPKPPTSGRALDSQDVKYSWDRFASISSLRANLLNSADPLAPVVGVTTPDSSTATFKLAFPYGSLGAMLAFYRHLPIMPIEAESKFDPRTQIYGTSAWRLKENTGDVTFEWQKNPDWYDADKVNLDGIKYFNLPEYSSAFAQFRSGALATYSVQQTDVLGLKRDIPQMNMLGQEDFDDVAAWMRFGYKPGSPFLDERVRQAVSMSIDRKLFVETFGNVDQFKDAGLEVPQRWNTALPAGNAYWLDPEDEKNFGPNAKYFQYLPAEAKKLLAAAGYPNGLSTQFGYVPDRYGDEYVRTSQVLAQMLQQDGNFHFNIVTPPYNTDWRPNYHFGTDKHDGIAYGGGGSSYPDVDGWLHVYIAAGQERSGHVGPDGKPDAKVEDLIAKQRVESDQERRFAILKELQQYMAGKMYVLFNPGQALGFNLAWPWLGNWNVYRSYVQGINMVEGGIHEFIDQSKKT